MNKERGHDGTLRETQKFPPTFPVWQRDRYQTQVATCSQWWGNRCLSEDKYQLIQTFKVQWGELRRTDNSHQYFWKPSKMRSFSVALVVAVMLTFICIQESSAVPATEVRTHPKLLLFNKLLYKVVFFCLFFCWTHLCGPGDGWRRIRRNVNVAVLQQVHELVEAVADDSLVAAGEEIPVESWKVCSVNPMT